MDTSTTTRIRCISRAVLLAVIALGLLTPAIDQCVRPASARDTLPELRSPARFPAWPHSSKELVLLPKKFDAWYLDHFGLRDVFLRWNNAVKWFALGVSPTHKILLGEDGWVFPTENLALEDHRGALPLQENALAAWRRMLEGRRAFFAEHGIQYMFVVAPYKSRVYPERMPARYPIHGPTRAQQIEAYLEQHSDFRILDLRDALLAAKEADTAGDFAFYPYGIHWTHRGAHAAYVEIARELARRFPSITPLPDDAFEVVATDLPGDTWAGRLYMKDLLHQEKIEWRPREIHAQYPPDFEDSAEFHSVREGSDLPRAFVLHDSFGWPLRPYLAEHFSSLDCIWTQEPMIDRILAAKPDVMIQIFDEQTIGRITPELTRQEDGGARERRFERARDVVWRFDASEIPRGLEAEGPGALRLEDNTLVHDRRGAGDFLNLPELDFPRGADLLVSFDLELPVQSEVMLFYRTRLQPEIRRDQTAGVLVFRGRDRFVIELPAADFAGRLSLWTGLQAGNVRIHAIEIRAGRADGEMRPVAALEASTAH